MVNYGFSLTKRDFRILNGNLGYKKRLSFTRCNFSSYKWESRTTIYPRKLESQTLCLIKLTKGNNWFNILNIRGENMSKKSVVIMPDTQKVLENMGEQIKMARLRRNLSTELVAERAGISRATLWAVEKGTPTVAIGTYAAVLHALGGMDKDLERVAKDDEFGRRIQDLNLVTPKRAKRK